MIVFALLSAPAVLGALGTAGLRPDLVFDSRTAILGWAGGCLLGLLGGGVAGTSWYLSGKHLGGRRAAQRLTRVLSVVGSSLLMALPGLSLVLFAPIAAAFLNDSGPGAAPVERQEDSTSARKRVLSSPPVRAPEKSNAP